MSRLASIGLFGLALAQVVAARQVPPPLSVGGDGRVSYVETENHDRVPDFSHAGYRGGGVAIPVVPARVNVGPVEGDDGARIQAAIDFVSALAPDGHGLRGAVLLAPGRYEIAGQLKIRASGVVLRGAGTDASGSVLVATGTGRRALIEVGGDATRRSLSEDIAIVDDRVPVGATRLRVASTKELTIGRQVTIERPSPQSWVDFAGMADAPGRQPYQWKAGTLNVTWDRTIVAIDGDAVILDAPITTALEKGFGGGTLRMFEAPGYLADVGIERLRCESVFDISNPLDEQHAWNAIDLHAVRDGWVVDVVGVHFAGSAVQLGAMTARITVQDCASLEPVSEIAGYRRMAFHSRGQQTLFLRCRSVHGHNDFSTGYLAAGPNVFLQCEAVESFGFSGSIGSWSSGLLFDGVKIDRGALRLDNLETFNQGAGWNAANSMLWQCAASTIICRMPPGATNWAVGVWGQFVGDGRWSAVNEFARPDSLYRAQLGARLGAGALAALEPLRRDEPKTPVPSLEQCVPDLAARLNPPPRPPAPPLALEDGWLVADGRLLTGRQTGGEWWLGRIEPGRAGELRPALTRFAPGLAGTGLTDELPSVVAAMVERDQVAFRHHYGLWYDRRRIDHQMIRRPDADVWPPFYEQPFARSGRGEAWDGLSRYDLTKYNPWYFGRLREFATLARESRRVLVNEMYFQHNIIESGAHWVDSPWRTVNNINDTGFTEPPPFTGDTIKMADEFYELSHPLRRDLHRAYIRQCLGNLADEPNVIHTLSAENTGPLHFMQFWLDVVAEWKRETGRRPLIALSATKDVQDAILADPARAALVDVIDFTYWFRTGSGEEYAPLGGKSLAPRQHLRRWRGGRPTAASIAGMVAEYRGRFPDKAVITGLEEAEGWSCAAAGGSFPRLPASTDAGLLAALPRMRPVAAVAEGTSVLAGRDGGEYFVYTVSGSVDLDLTTARGLYLVREVDLRSGALVEPEREISGGSVAAIGKAAKRPVAFWLERR